MQDHLDIVDLLDVQEVAEAVAVLLGLDVVPAGRREEL